MLLYNHGDSIVPEHWHMPTQLSEHKSDAREIRKNSMTKAMSACEKPFLLDRAFALCLSVLNPGFDDSISRCLAIGSSALRTICDVSLATRNFICGFWKVSSGRGTESRQRDICDGSRGQSFIVSCAGIFPKRRTERILHRIAHRPEPSLRRSLTLQRSFAYGEPSTLQLEVQP